MSRAWLNHDGMLYFSSTVEGGSTAADHAFHHPILQLILGIHEKYPEKAHRMLRNRIHFSEKLGEWEVDWIKTGAKRADGGVVFSEVDFQSGERVSFDPFQESDGRAADWVENHGDREIEASLTFPGGKTLSGHNRQSRNQMWHAEVDVLIQYYLDKNRGTIHERLWDGVLQIDLKPCRWCAALWGYALSLESSAPEAIFKVNYKNHDSGKWAENTWFDRSMRVTQKMSLPGGG